MEFGLFVQAHVPRHEVDANPQGAEHARLMRELELAVACDRSGWKYVWSVEHHFLEEYSHISASEIFLPYVAAQTQRIHVGSAIYNITPPVNHPARIAERVAMLDHLSEGRFEFGTGRGSSSTEFKGFGIPDGDTTRAMYDESLREILRMWRETKYSYQGRYFSMPERNVLPKPYSQPHPPLWVACGSPSTFEKAARLGLGALCFSLGSPRDFEPLIKVYKDTIKYAEPVGDYVNDNIMCVTHLCCLPDRNEALKLNTHIKARYYQSLVYRWLDTFPRPAMVPPWPDVMPEPTLDELKQQVEAGIIAVGDPEDCAYVAEQYEKAGADQLVVSPMTTTMPYETAVESIRLFGAEVIPRFDHDPTFRSDRMRLGAAV